MPAIDPPQKTSLTDHELDRIEMRSAAGLLSRLRRHVESYEYEEARAIATQLLDAIDSQVR